MRNSILQNTFPVLQKENVTDDLSYAAIIDYETTKEVPNVVFDKEQWFEEVRAHNQKIRELLNQHNIANTVGEDSGNNSTESSEPNLVATESHQEQSTGNQTAKAVDADMRSPDPLDTRSTQDGGSALIIEEGLIEEKNNNDSATLNKEDTASSERSDQKASISLEKNDNGGRREVGRQQAKREPITPKAKRAAQDPIPQRLGRTDVERRRIESAGKSSAAQQFEKGVQIFIDRVGRFLDDILYADDRSNGPNNNPDKKN